MANEPHEEESFINIMTMKGKTGSDLELLVFMGQSDLKILKKDLEKVFEQVLGKCKGGNINSCSLKFLIVPDIVEKTNGLFDLCTVLCDQFIAPANFSKQLSSLKDFKLNFTYDQDDLIIEKNYNSSDLSESAQAKAWWKFW